MSGRGRVFYGWKLVAGLSWTELISWGVLYYAFSVFITPMRHQLGWSTAQITGALSVGLLVAGAAAIPVGRWIDRHGTRWLMTLGSCLAVGLVFFWSRVSSLGIFYLLWIGIGLAMAAVLYEPAFAVIAVWFRRRRDRALTVLTFVAGLASVIFIPLTNWLVQTFGWRDAVETLAIILAAGTIPVHALLLRHRPAEIGEVPDGEDSPLAETDTTKHETSVPARQALRDETFWWITAGFVLAILAATAVTVHLIPYLISRGYSAGYAASMAGLVGIFALPGRLIFTPLGARWPRHLITGAIFACQTAAILVLLLMPGTIGVVLFVALFGAGFGAITPARAALVAERYGPDYYASINSVLAFFLTGAKALAPVGAGLILAAGSYHLVFIVLLGIAAAAIIPIQLSARGKRSVSAAKLPETSNS